MFKLIKQDYPDFINEILGSLDEASIQVLKNILSSKCYSLNDPNKPEQRRNVTVKRKTNNMNNSIFHFFLFNVD